MTQALLSRREITSGRLNDGAYTAYMHEETSTLAYFSGEEWEYLTVEDTDGDLDGAVKEWVKELRADTYPSERVIGALKTWEALRPHSAFLYETYDPHDCETCGTNVNTISASYLGDETGALGFPHIEVTSNYSCYGHLDILISNEEEFKARYDELKRLFRSALKGLKEDDNADGVADLKKWWGLVEKLHSRKSKK